MTPRAELLHRIVSVCVGLDAAILESFADQLEKLPSEPDVEILNGWLTRGVAQPEARAALIELLKYWRAEAPTVKPHELAWAIWAGNSTDNFHRARQSLEIVWTGPASRECTLRRTDQALLALIQQAKTSVIVVTFAAYKVPHIVTALVAAAARGVDVTLILESTEESDGKVTVSAIAGLGEELANAATVYVWPLENRETESRGKHGSLHVKCAVADANAALISSANLTGYAMNLNMELGVLVKDGDLPGDLDTHLRALIRDKVVVPLRAGKRRR